MLRFCLPLALLLMITHASTPVAAAPHGGPQFVSFVRFDGWTRTPGATPSETVLTSPEITTRADWNELIASWNVQMPPEASLRVEARALAPGHATKFYDLGFWAGPDHTPSRTSLNGQKDADGDVSTDTLILSKPAHAVQVRLVLDGDVTPTFLSLSLTDSRLPRTERPPNKAAWGRVIDVPERSQLSYPGGGHSWCSPTSLSMVMTYWAHQCHQPDWAVDVPEAVKGTYDVAWEGTGNWPFNTAYAGSFPGLRGYVTRFADLRELEDWIAAGIPVILSVGYNAEVGGDTPGNNGHILVCVGFTPAGDPVINDPWTRFDKGEHVRRVFRRANLEKMWAHSQNAVYCVYPADWPPLRHFTEEKEHRQP